MKLLESNYIQICLAVFLAFYVLGCSDSSVPTQQNADTEIIDGVETEGEPYYEFKLKITQHVEGNNYVILDLTTYPFTLSNPAFFTTNRTPNGNSTFSVNWGAVWINPNQDYAIHSINPSTGGDPNLASVVYMSGSSGGFNDLGSINLQEGKTYVYQMGPHTWDDDD